MRKYNAGHIEKALGRYIDKHFDRSVATAAEEFGCTKAYIYYMLSGDRAIPDHILKLLGYERRQPKAYYVRK